MDQNQTHPLDLLLEDDVALFDVLCENCGDQSEMILKLSDIDIDDKLIDIKCDKCNNVSLKKIPNYKTSFQLKGDGWYKDGYSSSKSKG